MGVLAIILQHTQSQQQLHTCCISTADVPAQMYLVAVKSTSTAITLWQQLATIKHDIIQARGSKQMHNLAA